MKSITVLVKHVSLMYIKQTLIKFCLHTFFWALICTKNRTIKKDMRSNLQNEKQLKTECIKLPVSTKRNLTCKQT